MNAADLQREVFASFARADMDGLFRLYDDSCVIREALSLPWGGEFVGKDGLRALLGKMTSHFEVTSRVVDIFESNPSRIVALIDLQLKSNRTGRTVELQVAEVTCSRDGLIVEQMPFYWDTQLISNEA
jgi:uncharacterized protein